MFAFIGGTNYLDLKYLQWIIAKNKRYKGFKKICTRSVETQIKGGLTIPKDSTGRWIGSSKSSRADTNLLEGVKGESQEPGASRNTTDQKEEKEEAWTLFGYGLQ